MYNTISLNNYKLLLHSGQFKDRSTKYDDKLTSL